jgi:hypothetical protein
MIFYGSLQYLYHNQIVFKQSKVFGFNLYLASYGSNFEVIERIVIRFGQLFGYKLRFFAVIYESTTKVQDKNTKLIVVLYNHFYLSASKVKNKEGIPQFQIITSFNRPDNAQEIYADTHLTDIDRVGKLFGMIIAAFIEAKIFLTNF